MFNRVIVAVLCLGISVGSLMGQSSVVTLTDQEVAGLMAAACGPQSVPAKGTHVHRNAAGNMLYIIAEGLSESLIYAQQQNCNPLSPETLNLWRNIQDGAVIAQLAKRYDGERLLVGGSTDGISGKHFDLEPSGQYLMISHGDVSSISPVERPYIRTIELQMDARRLFMRQGGGLLAVGNNKATNQLEAVPVSLQGSTAVAGAPIVVPGVPAGVMVLDYNDKTDELLLGGLGAGGSTSFAIANLATGQARLVDNAKPGATTALFIADPGLAARLMGQPVPAAAAAPGPAQQPQGEQKRGGFNPFGWFGRN